MRMLYVWQSDGGQMTTWRTSDPLQCTKSHACHTKATGERRRPRDDRGYIWPLGNAPSPTPATQKPPAERRRPRDARAYIRPLGSAPSPRPATQKIAKATGRAAETKGRQGVHPTPCTCSAPSAAPATQKPPAERQRPRDARAYI